MPEDVRAQARRAYRQFQQDPDHSSLEFKPLKGTKQPVYSVRIGLRYRAIGVMIGNGEIVWQWIGSREDYGKLIP